MTRVWKEILVIIEGLLIPSLSDILSEMKPLSDKEVDEGMLFSQNLLLSLIGR